MRNLKVIYCTTLIAVCLLTYGLVFAQGAFPGWFWKTPVKKGVLFAVGYASRYAHIDTSYEEALKDAAQRLFWDLSSHLSHKYGVIHDPEGIRIFPDESKFTADESKYEQFQKSLVHIDSAIVGDLVIVLVATEKVKVKKRLIKCDNRPKWVTRIPYKKKFNFAVGQAPGYYYSFSSWKEAELKARIELGQQIYLKVRGLRFTHIFEFLDVWDFSVEADFKKVQAYKRWVDPESGNCYVLLRMPEY